MLNDFFKKMSIESKGVLASILGLILILGTLGKLNILQGILNSIMILVGLFLLVWGLNTSNGYSKVKSYFNKKK